MGVAYVIKHCTVSPTREKRWGSSPFMRSKKFFENIASVPGREKTLKCVDAGLTVTRHRNNWNLKIGERGIIFTEVNTEGWKQTEEYHMGGVNMTRGAEPYERYAKCWDDRGFDSFFFRQGPAKETAHGPYERDYAIHETVSASRERYPGFIKPLIF